MPKWYLGHKVAATPGFKRNIHRWPTSTATRSHARCPKPKVAYGTMRGIIEDEAL
jgi:hypothetical protein